MNETDAARIEAIQKRLDAEAECATRCLFDADALKFKQSQTELRWLLSRLRAKDRVIEAAGELIEALDDIYGCEIVDAYQRERISSARTKYDAAVKEENA